MYEFVGTYWTQAESLTDYLNKQIKWFRFVLKKYVKWMLNKLNDQSLS